jgi:UDP-2-acetamido-2,6-beta-L-arabino-hexul-4-ose reductase
MRVLVTGSRGFIGKNLAWRMRELAGFELLRFDRGDPVAGLQKLVDGCDAVIHLAGENRPADVRDFSRVNGGLTRLVCDRVRRSRRVVPFILASSTQAGADNPYGASKLESEAAVRQLHADLGNPCVIHRLPNVFGKWCRPDYNSVVATFCHHIAHDLPIRIDAPTKRLCLVHVDDVVTEFLRELRSATPGVHEGGSLPEYSISVGELADQIRSFSNCRTGLVTERVGTGLIRALYSTYVSYLPTEKFAYDLPRYGDERGVFVEMLKTPDCGQFSYFTAHPGVTRGGHYHHTKTEKFLVIKGVAKFGFRNLVTDETFEIFTSGDAPKVVETVPGWTHDITNVGSEEMVVMLWANEIFDRAHPDTVASKV